MSTGRNSGWRSLTAWQKARTVLGVMLALVIMSSLIWLPEGWWDKALPAPLPPSSGQAQQDVQPQICHQDDGDCMTKQEYKHWLHKKIRHRAWKPNFHHDVFSAKPKLVKKKIHKAFKRYKRHHRGFADPETGRCCDWDPDWAAGGTSGTTPAAP